MRQDSGDPMAFGENAIAFYQHHGIDPRDKMLVFSDGLDLETILQLTDHFAGRIRLSFGWGTNLPNDLGFGALSLVVKVVEANGQGTVKSSDNLAKATGAAEDVARFKRIFGHTVTAWGNGCIPFCKSSRMFPSGALPEKIINGQPPAWHGMPRPYGPLSLTADATRR